MMAGAAKGAGKFLGSAYVATGLLAFLGLWAVFASVAGLDDAFTSPVFLGAVLLLALSTTLCAWQRTKVAVRRMRMLRAAASSATASSVAAPSDQARYIEIACDPALDPEAILAAAKNVLAGLGIRGRAEGASITAITPPWAVWGSPVFHWALVALMVVVMLGGLFRSSGQIGIATGRMKPDRPESYGQLTAGPLKRWNAERSIRVDAFDINYSFAGVDRGPTPTVSVLDSAGRVVESQDVYPNHTLKVGALSIYPADYGLSAEVSILTTAGAEPQRFAELLDFSGKAEGGTVPVAPLTLKGTTAEQHLTVAISVPLDRAQEGYIGRIPNEQTARVLVTAADGMTVSENLLRPGEEVGLPTGDRLRLDGMGYYARLQLVDDPSVPWLYLTIGVAMLGLGVATFARQGIVALRVIEAPEGSRLLLRADLWRNATVSRTELASELASVLAEKKAAV